MEEAVAAISEVTDLIRSLDSKPIGRSAGSVFPEAADHSTSDSTAVKNEPPGALPRRWRGWGGGWDLHCDTPFSRARDQVHREMPVNPGYGVAPAVGPEASLGLETLPPRPGEVPPTLMGPVAEQ